MKKYNTQAIEEQIQNLTNSIKILSQHLIKNKKDKTSLRSLRNLLNTRTKLTKYLLKVNIKNSLKKNEKQQ